MLKLLPLKIFVHVRPILRPANLLAQIQQHVTVRVVAILKSVPIIAYDCYTIHYRREKLFMNVNSFSLAFVTWVRLDLVRVDLARVGLGTN